MRSLKLTFLAMCLALLCSSRSSFAQDLSTPEATVRSFLTAFCSGDMSKAVVCIENAKYDSAFDALSADLKKHAATPKVTDVTTQLDGDQATVKISGTVAFPPDNKADPFASTVKLHKTDGNWHIVPDKAVATAADEKDVINSVAYALTQPQVLVKARDSARAVSCLSNMKQLGLGCIMFVQDYDEKFELKADSYKKAIMPYVKNEQIFTCPSDDPGVMSYSFNPHIAGVKLAKIGAPAKTVLLYEGKSGKLNFKHDGKAGVTYVDGHAKMITEEQAKQLRWMP